MSAQPAPTLRRCKTRRIRLLLAGSKLLPETLYDLSGCWYPLSFELDLGALSTWRQGRSSVSCRVSYGAVVAASDILLIRLVSWRRYTLLFRESWYALNYPASQLKST